MTVAVETSIPEPVVTYVNTLADEFLKTTSGVELTKTDTHGSASVKPHFGAGAVRCPTGKLSASGAGNSLSNCFQAASNSGGATTGVEFSLKERRITTICQACFYCYHSYRMSC